MPPLRWSLPLRLRTPSGEIVLAAFAALYALGARLLRLEPIEIGGDALNKWHFARQWFYAFDITSVPWNHHLSRFGVNVPVHAAQTLFGRNPLVYYVVAVSVFVTTALLVYLIGRVVHGKAAGVLATIWFVSFPSWDRAGSQVSPDSFGALYVGLSMLLLLGYERARSRKLVWLCASSSALFLAYLAKEPFAAFVGGGMVATYLISRNLKHAALYGAVPLGFLALESVFYRAVSDYSSRFALISTTHGKRPILIDNIFDVFGRFTSLPGFWDPLLIFALVGAVALPFLCPERRRRLWPLIWLPLVFFAFYTFAIRRLNPLSLWSRFLARYLDVGVPFCALLASVFLVAFTAFLAKRFLPALVARAEPYRDWGWVAGVVVFVAFGVANYLDDPPSAQHPLVTTRKIHAVLNDAYARGLPITAVRGDRHGRRLALKAAYKLYLDDDKLAVAGTLPDWATIETPNDRLVRNGAPARRPGCEVEVWADGRELKLARLSLLPPTCDGARP
jgi:4-amino-4-deoxy-L-arabinose transferase-like glycosyltransferase